MCAVSVNSRPVSIIRSSLADPDKILSCSPNSLRGPSRETWLSLGAQRNYSGQQQLLQSHLERFSKYYKLYYANKLYSNSNMATRSELQQNDIVLIVDLASNSGLISYCNPLCKFNCKFRPWRSWAISLNIFVVDQCTQRHNKKHQPTCLDVFDKNLHALLYSVPPI